MTAESCSKQGWLSAPSQVPALQNFTLKTIGQENSVYLQKQFEELIEFAAGPLLSSELFKAQKVFFAEFPSAESLENDPAGPQLMAGFSDFYVYDWKIGETGETPAELFLKSGQFHQNEDAAAFESFTRTLHSLFEVRRSDPGKIRFRDLFSGRDYDIFERRKMVSLAKGDLIDGRLIPLDGRHILSPAVFYQPAAAKKLILAELKRRKKAGADFDGKSFLRLLLCLWVKATRYQSVDLERLYAFRDS